MKLLVTGAAGFIGMHVCERLLGRGESVQGIDNLNDYYDPQLKQARLERLERSPTFRFEKVDVADSGAMTRLFEQGAFDGVIHLAAQAGVRYSITNPQAYIQSNLLGFGNVLECCRRMRVRHLVFASSSSVYGGSRKIPFTESDPVDRPVSLYAATKKANELMAYSYSHLYRFPITGLRFFTVYGPWGRPDMGYYLFAKAMVEGRPIDVFNHGAMKRDLTYIDDITEGVVRVLDRPPALGNGDSGGPPYRVFNIGNHDPVPLMDLIHRLEASLGITAKMRMLPMQPGDVPETFADVSALEAWVGFRPSTPIAVGIERFVEWFRAYHRVGER